MSKIYTRTGDTGTTGLVGGQRVKKNELRIETYGTVDELSSAIGVARATLLPLIERHAYAAHLDAWLAWTQDMLLNLGSELATTAEKRRQGKPAVQEGDVLALERAIDEAQQQLAPLRTFIHPSGSVPGAHLHFARTVCRRAERLLVTLHDQDPSLSPQTLRYLNRLSDALFVWARRINAEIGIEEYLWNPASAPPRSSE
jgi:cob(I)alamin adenosyltransferase